MAPVRDLMQSATRSVLNLLIKGEPGAGRETLARAVHGERSAGEFIALESPLTNVRDFEARIAQARGGTLFLRRLAELPAHLQTKLAHTAHVRLMTAVEPSFPKAVRRAQVEPVLLARFSCVEMPPLRERRQDIPALSSWFLEQYCASNESDSRKFSQAALELLTAFPWKGNGRELGSFIRAVAASVRGRLLGAEQLLAQIRLESGALAAYRLPLREARWRFEREYIATVIEQHHGRIGGAAQTLGMQRTNLYRKMRQLRLWQNRIRFDTESRNRA
jgi:DNA-binding NtrC family response regulator